MPKETKATDNEIVERKRQIRQMMIQQWDRNKIYKTISEKYNISERQVFEYIKDINKENLEIYKDEIPNELVNIVNTYKFISALCINDRRYKDAIEALDKISKIIGIMPETNNIQNFFVNNSQTKNDVKVFTPEEESALDEILFTARNRGNKTAENR